MYSLGSTSSPDDDSVPDPAIQSISLPAPPTPSNRRLNLPSLPCAFASSSIAPSSAQRPCIPYWVVRHVPGKTEERPWGGRPVGERAPVRADDALREFWDDRGWVVRAGGVSRQTEDFLANYDPPTPDPLEVDPVPIRPRFDWRLRAISREKAKPDKKRKHKRRIAPQQTVLQEHEPYYHTVHRYSEHFNGLLDAEIAAEEAVLHQRLSTWSTERLSEEGYCLTDMTAFWLEEKHLGRRTATFTRGPGVQLPENRFESGTQVLVSRIDPLTDEPAKGSLISRTPLQLKVSFPDQVEFDSPELEGAWRLDLGHSSLVHNRMREAINHLHRDVRSQEAVMATDREETLNGTHLRDVILRGKDQGDMNENVETSGVFRDNQLIYSWAKRYMRPNPVVVEGDPVIDGLNATQVRAMAQMIAERFSLVQGPPGTGKTKTIIETIKLLKVHFETPQPILVCTYTNVAVDNLVEGFVAAGVNPIRVAFGGKTRASLEPYTYEYKMQNHPLYSQAEKVSETIKELEGEVKDTSIRAKEVAKKVNDGRTNLAQRLDGMLTAIAKREDRIQAKRAQWYALTQQMTKDVLGEADVICTTCLTAASRVLEATDFPVVFLDEASMSTEPASLVPLMKGSRHVALIGDHKQLPPVIVSQIAKSNQLDRSLFERLIVEGIVPSIMLDIQYRMHPAISAFPSLEFYGTNSGGNILSRLAPPNSQHLTKDGNGDRPSVVFLDHAGEESSKDRSRVNWNEAHIVASVVEDLLLTNPELTGDDIGIIAPYAAQISLLTRLFNVNARYKQRFEIVLGEHRAMQIKDIEIKTVDGFEGREKEIIIFSTVRNNAGGHIGFLADRGRLNVGLTRAKRGLFIVGSISTLRKGRSVETAKEETGAVAWRNFAQYLVKEGRVSRIGGMKLQQAIYGHLRAARRDPPLLDSGVVETRI
ncbi:P-loop containing nucleoside triphosphate hydrolase protein [Armillaria borealis]|uniref:P-loop containing nucleoside triphosphate hydrolase protein n=1 Tax=Armillaria borealis TaxID=47425 RepID=A0AA39MFB2_9AGAR|nr:P-loop containing nucleoside triphosphate hydrolase protein [Armillaria borealis]